MTNAEPEDRARVELENYRLLEEDLLEGRLEFRSHPIEAFVQFSTFCNMSCIMCHAGRNPPVESIRPDVLGRFGSQVAPHLTLLNPHGGSEPLALGWGEALQIARDHGLRMCINTNGQFLDEKRFFEMKDHLEWLRLSIDSHIPEVLEKIRPGAKVDRVYRNLETTARLSREHGIDCGVLVVFMTENAASLPETVTYLCDIGITQIVVIQLIDNNGVAGYLNPLIHFSAGYIDWIKHKCIEVAREKRVLLVWHVGEEQVFEHRPVRPVWSESRRAYEDLTRRLSLRHPGYCFLANSRIRVRHDGDVAPCGYATYGELSLGSLATQDFDEIWNDVQAQDLRRGMMTGDVPSLCQTCFRHDLPKPRTHLPFVDGLADECRPPVQRIEPVLEVLDPSHMERRAERPRFVVKAPPEGIGEFFLALSLGGLGDDTCLIPLRRARRRSDAIVLTMPREPWSRLRTNCGYWWTILALSSDRPGTALRTSEIRCLIRHRDIPRLAGSTLGYLDLGHLPAADLGGNIRIGWDGSEGSDGRPATQDRQGLRQRGQIPPVRPVGDSNPVNGSGFLTRLRGRLGRGR